MKLPNAENAYVPEPKVTGYLLDPTHPVGGSKARFFLAFGFRASEWPVFERALNMAEGMTSWKWSIHPMESSMLSSEQWRHLTVEIRKG